MNLVSMWVRKPLCWNIFSFFPSLAVSGYISLKYLFGVFLHVYLLPITEYTEYKGYFISLTDGPGWVTVICVQTWCDSLSEYKLQSFKNFWLLCGSASWIRPGYDGPLGADSPCYIRAPRLKETQKNYKRCSRAARDTKCIKKKKWLERLDSHFVFVLWPFKVLLLLFAADLCLFVVSLCLFVVSLCLFVVSLCIFVVSLHLFVVSLCLFVVSLRLFAVVLCVWCKCFVCLGPFFVSVQKFWVSLQSLYFSLGLVCVSLYLLGVSLYLCCCFCLFVVTLCPVAVRFCLFGVNFSLSVAILLLLSVSLGGLSPDGWSSFCVSSHLICIFTSPLWVILVCFACP